MSLYFNSGLFGSVALLRSLFITAFGDMIRPMLGRRDAGEVARIRSVPAVTGWLLEKKSMISSSSSLVSWV
jgi:hypothetical protein